MQKSHSPPAKRVAAGDSAPQPISCDSDSESGTDADDKRGSALRSTSHQFAQVVQCSQSGQYLQRAQRQARLSANALIALEAEGAGSSSSEHAAAEADAGSPTVEPFNSSRVSAPFRACFRLQADRSGYLRCALPPDTISPSASGRPHKAVIKEPADWADLRKHVEGYHPAVMEAIRKESQKSGGNPLALVNSLVARAQRSAHQASTLEACVRRFNSHKSNRLRAFLFALTAWVTEHGIPYSACSGPRWSELLARAQQLTAEDRIPTIRTAIDLTLPVMDYILSDALIKQLQQASVVVIVTDGWSAADGSYMVVIKYCWSEPATWGFRCHALDFFTSPSRTADAIALHLRTSIDNLLLPNQIVGLCVTDGAERKMSELAKLDNWWCVAHRLHNVDVRALERSDVNRLYLIIRNLITSIRSTSSLRQQLEDAQQPGTALTLVTESETRWNSRFQATERFMELWPHIKRMGLSDGGTLSDAEVQILLGCQAVLRHFATAITVLEASVYPTLCLVPAQLAQLAAVIAKPNAISAVVELQTALREALYHYFPDFWAKPNFALMAAALDLRYADLPWCSSATRDAIWDEIAVQAFALKDGNDEGTTIELLKATTDSARRMLQRANYSFRAEREQDPTSDISPVDWWKSHISPALVPLERVVRLFFTVPATSADAERFFKGAAFVQDGRPNLSAETLSRQTRVRDAIKTNRLVLDDIVATATLLTTPQ